MCIKAWLEDYHLPQQIKRLSDEERRAIIEKSPLEAGAFQGEGFHVFLKSEPDFSKAYVTSLGEITGEQAEDWIIRQYLRQEQNFKKIEQKEAPKIGSNIEQAIQKSEIKTKTMKTLNIILPIMSFLTMILGCGEAAKPSADWTKARKIAGKEQKLSHVSGLVVDDKYAYVTTGGNLADQNEGLSGLRKIALDSGTVTILDDGRDLPQSDLGGLVQDEKFVYWNAGGKIVRVSKEGGRPEAVVSENVGIGGDLVVDNEKIYWANHSYYSPNTPTKPSPIYAVAKQGGKPEIFADQQQIPGSLVTDEKYLYWHTADGIYKQLKTGGQREMVYQITKDENADELAQDAENLYFGFRSKGNSRWDLQKISKNGGEPQTLVKSFSLKPFVVDDANIYFFNEDGITKDALCKIPKNGGNVSKLDIGYASGVIAQGKTLVYFSGLDDVYSFAK